MNIVKELANEYLELMVIDRQPTYRGQRDRWFAYGMHDAYLVRVTLYPEDVRLIRETGFDTSWANSAEQDVILPTAITVTLRHCPRTGLRPATVAAMPDDVLNAKQPRKTFLRAADDLERNRFRWNSQMIYYDTDTINTLCALGIIHERAEKYTLTDKGRQLARKYNEVQA